MKLIIAPYANAISQTRQLIFMSTGHFPGRAVELSNQYDDEESGEEEYVEG